MNFNAELQNTREYSLERENGNEQIQPYATIPISNTSIYSFIFWMMRVPISRACNTAQF